MLETIPNRHPHLPTHVRLTHPFTGLCPISGEPQASSTITISYEAGSRFLETKALRRYIESFAGENAYGVRDLEEAVQVIAQECANALVVQVIVHAHYELSTGSMDVEVTAMPCG